jgi:hypothetical protein
MRPKMSPALRHARELHRFGLRELLWARAFPVGEELESAKRCGSNAALALRDSVTFARRAS